MQFNGLFDVGKRVFFGLALAVAPRQAGDFDCIAAGFIRNEDDLSNENLQLPLRLDYSGIVHLIGILFPSRKCGLSQEIWDIVLNIWDTGSPLSPFEPVSSII